MHLHYNILLIENHPKIFTRDVEGKETENQEQEWMKNRATLCIRKLPEIQQSVNKIQEILTSKMRKSIVRILKYMICLVTCSYLHKERVIRDEIVLPILRNNMMHGE